MVDVRVGWQDYAGSRASRFAGNRGIHWHRGAQRVAEAQSGGDKEKQRLQGLFSQRGKKNEALA